MDRNLFKKVIKLAIITAVIFAINSNFDYVNSQTLSGNQLAKFAEKITMEKFCECFPQFCCDCHDGTKYLKEDDQQCDPCHPEECPLCCQRGTQLVDTCCKGHTNERIIRWDSCDVKPECPDCAGPPPPDTCDPNDCDGIKVNFRICTPYSDGYNGNPNNPPNPDPSKTFVEHFVDLVAQMGGKTCCEGITEWRQIPCDIAGSDTYIDACVPDEGVAQAIIEEWAEKGNTTGDTFDNRYDPGVGGIAGGGACNNNSDNHPNAFGVNTWMLLDDNYNIINPTNPWDGTSVSRCQCLGR